MIKSVETTIKNLKANGMEPYFVEDKGEALALLKKLIEKGSSVACGGSETLLQIGAIDLLRCGEYEFLDRYKKDLSREELEKIFIDSLSVDYYVSSSNAITESGELYNVDGNCNRISALSFGPKNVVIVAGVNKIVPTLADAVLRVKTVAAPKNCQRLGKDTYCSKAGKCVSVDNGMGEIMGAGCGSDNRICCTTLVSAKQRTEGRIKVILVNQKLGY